MALLHSALLFAALILFPSLDLGSAHSHSSPSVCTHAHDHAHHSHKDTPHGYKLPEELAEEEDMKLYGFGYPHDHDHDHDHHHHGHGHGHRHLYHIEATDPSGLGLWLNALGCSFLVSMASLVCLIILPVIFVKGKPSKAVVDSLALFGAGAMLGDAFLHQLPHAFGGEHSHSHGDHDHDDSSGHGHGHGHAHSIADLSTGLSILAGIALFLLVEKVVRYVEENSGGAGSWTHGHHHHNHNSKKKLKDDSNSNEKEEKFLDEGEDSKQVSNDLLKEDNPVQSESSLRKRTGSKATKGKGENVNASSVGNSTTKFSDVKEPVMQPSSLVFGYLNLFSDGVHNFTDGMALGSAFLLYGSVGGWSRTLFLLAHELPQESLRRDKVLRLFKLNTGQDDHAIMFLDDYIKQIDQVFKRMEGKKQVEYEVFGWFKNYVLDSKLETGIEHEELCSLLSLGGKVKDSHISILINAGVIIRQLIDPNMYWFAIPNIGTLLKGLAQGRNELISLLSRRRYKEMMLATLEKKRLRMSPLDMRFHLRDLIGSGHLRTDHTPTGLIIRVSKD